MAPTQSGVYLLGHREVMLSILKNEGIHRLKATTLFISSLFLLPHKNDLPLPVPSLLQYSQVQW